MKAKTQPPHPVSIVLDGIEDHTSEELVARAELHGARYANVEADELVLTNAHLDGVAFDGVTAARASLSGASLTEVAFSGLNVPVIDAPRTRWAEVEMSGRIGAFTAYESAFRSVHFLGCRLSFVNLRAAELLDVTFTDCSIEELDLGGATCRRVRLIDTQVNTLDVRQSTLKDFDLRDAELSTITGIERLSGATVTPDQVTLLAPLLAAHMGLRVEEHVRP